MGLRQIGLGGLIIKVKKGPVMQLYYYDKGRISESRAIDTLFTVYRAVHNGNGWSDTDLTLTFSFRGDVLTIETQGNVLCTGYFDEFDG